GRAGRSRRGRWFGPLNFCLALWNDNPVWWNTMVDDFEGRVLRRGTGDYEAARRATMWNALVPDRFPDVVVQAASEQDVVRAVRLARAEGLRIGVRSGGHSWVGNHVRDGGLLLDL